MTGNHEDYDKSVRAKFAHTDSIGDAIYLHAVPSRTIWRDYRATPLPRCSRLLLRELQHAMLKDFDSPFDITVDFYK